MRTGLGISWKALIFGSDTPSRKRKVATGCLFGFVFLCLYGVWTDFIPSRWWSSVSLAATHVVTVIAAGLLWWGMETGRIPTKQVLDRRRKIGAVLSILLLLWMALWIVLARAAPDLLTRVAGSSGSVSLTLKKKFLSSRRSCDYQVTGAVVMEHFPGYLCISLTSYLRLPAAGPMLLTGKKSPFGFHVSDVQSVAHPESALAR
jgi:hypothetical protein